MEAEGPAALMVVVVDPAALMFEEEFWQWRQQVIHLQEWGEEEIQR